MTKGEVLRYAIASALRGARKIIRGLKQGLTEEERYAVADHAVAQLKERGDPWRLNDEASLGETAFNMKRLRFRRPDGRHPPDTPSPLSVLKPRSPQAGAFHLQPEITRAYLRNAGAMPLKNFCSISTEI